MRLLLMLLLVMLLFGCASQNNAGQVNTAPVTNNAPSTAAPESQPPATPAENATPATPATPAAPPVEENKTASVNEKNNNPIWDDLMARHSKIKNGYSYDYSLNDENLVRQPGTVDHIDILGDNIRVQYYREIDYQDFKYDELFLDRSKKQAFITCTDINCKNLLGKARSVNYSEFAITTPIDVLESLNNSKDVMDQQYDGVDSTILQDSNGKETIKVWVSKFYGVPLKVEKSRNDKTVTWRYDTMVLNKVVAKNMTLLPSTEIIS